MPKFVGFDFLYDQALVLILLETVFSSREKTSIGAAKETTFRKML